MRLSRRQFLYVLGVGGLAAACSPMSREPDFTVVIHRDNQFEPSSLIVPRGAMVAWQNRADHVHTITADPAKAQMPERIIIPGEATPFDSGDVHSGERWAHTFDVPGTYIYFCRYHERDEMLGAIMVLDA